MAYRGDGATPQQRFNEKVAPANKNGCKLWTGGRTRKDEKGYGLFYADGQMRPAHRWALEQHLGRELGPGEDACHKCDVRLCVTLDHLFPGTRQDNVDDMIRKGRGSDGKPRPSMQGSKHHQAVLSEDDVRSIREWAAAGWPLQELSNVFGVTYPQVYRIINHQSWKHVS